MVLRKLGVVGAATSVVSADADIVYEAIDLRLKEMHRNGIFWRKVESIGTTFTLSAGVSSAHVGTNDILFPIKMTVKDGSLDEPVRVIGKIDYAGISGKTELGQPTKAIWKGSTEFVFHPVPLVATTATLTYEKIADDTTAGSAVDVDVSMIRHLKDIVAYDIGDDFGIDEQRMMRFQKESLEAEKNIRKLSVERKNYSPVAVEDWGNQEDSEYYGEDV
jgi:hypothetical protein